MPDPGICYILGRTKGLISSRVWAAGTETRMKGGKFEQRAPTVGRNAETLLESRSVAEVREVEAATRREIEDKREELRQLVGASYRDLIDSADSIVMMAKCCSRIMENLVGMSEGLKNCAADAKGDKATTSSRDMNSMQVMKRLYGIGSRVKYLVDTPEKIWGCLDEHMYFEAAERYLRAKEVQSLVSGAEHELSAVARLPLLLEPSFQGQISFRSRDRLQDIGLSAADYADALAAVAIVEDMSSTQVLSLFLDSRKVWLRGYLDGAKLEESGCSASEYLSKALQVIQLSVCHVGQLFLEVSHGSPPLLLSTILTTPPSSQLFGGIFNPENELKLWKVHVEKLEARMVALSGELVAEATASFVASCARELSSEAKRLLDVVSSGKELAEMERSIKLAVENQEALRDSLEWLKTAFGQEVVSPWTSLSTLVLKKPLDLWEALLESCFMERLKGIVDSRTAEITATVDMAETYLENMGLASCLEQPCVGLLKQLHSGGAKPAEWRSEITSYFGPEVCQIKDKVDETLKLLLEDLLTFLGDPKTSARTDEIAAYLHGRIFSRMLKISKKLEMLLRGFSEGLPEGQVAVVQVEKALFLGRISLALGEHLIYLPTLLGIPEQWSKGPALVKAQSLPRHSWFEAETDKRSKVQPKSDELQKLQDALRTQWDLAHNLWVSWSTETLVIKFSEELAEDERLLATGAYKGWEDTVLRQEGDVEIKMSLPASPSSCAISLLFVATQEIYRVGGHLLDKSIVHCFAASLLDRVLAAYENLLFRDSVSEKGLLQLLFDVRFLADVLIGLDRAPSVLNRQRESSGSCTQKRIKELLSQLCSKLDPIDWATYEPQLWKNEKLCYQRSSILFGFLTALNRLHTDSEHKTQLGTNYVTLSLAPAPPRFTYLPISMPVASSPKGATTPRLNSPTDFAAFEAPNESSDSTNALAALANARPLFKSLMGQVGSKLGEGTLKFGSILGEGWPNLGTQAS